jgi:hypothetical protein
MLELGRTPCEPRPWRPSTTKLGRAGPIPDLVPLTDDERAAADDGQAAPAQR